ncbi:MAG: ABC transporter substrate-binding protein, partial [Pseudomonadota bacterium]|nr:ABC transporter substrate-binding protein [Pseudomonadota bacterium]
ATKVTMPFVEDTLARAQRLMGPDPWSYGLAGNAHVLDRFLHYHHAQGLSPRRVQVDDMFHPGSVEAFSL